VKDRLQKAFDMGMAALNLGDCDRLLQKQSRRIHCLTLRSSWSWQIPLIANASHLPPFGKPLTP
jgi:hypothetical protein